MRAVLERSTTAQCTKSVPLVHTNDLYARKTVAARSWCGAAGYRASDLVPWHIASLLHCTKFRCKREPSRHKRPAAALLNESLLIVHTIGGRSGCRPQYAPDYRLASEHGIMSRSQGR